MQWSWRALLILALAAMLAACSAKAPPEALATRVAETDHPRAKLVLGSRVLIHEVVIVAPKFRQVGELTQASVEVQNLTEKTFGLEYRFEWEDEAGFGIDATSVWRRFTLTPNQIQKFSSTGRAPEAKNIVFTVRLPHDSL